MKDWFLALARREQIFVTALGGVLVTALFLLLIVQPLYAGAARRAESVERKQHDLVWMLQAAALLRNPSGQPTAGGCSGQSLVVIVANTAREAGLGQSLRRNQPAGENSIRVRFESADAAALIEWLGRLQNSCSIFIESATIDRTATRGIVNAALSLGRNN